MGRIVEGTLRAQAAGRRAAAIQSPKESPVGDYLNRIAAYLPGEVVTAYLTILKILQDAMAGNGQTLVCSVQSTIIVILAVFTPCYVLWWIHDPDALQSERRTHAVVSFLAFLIWVLALGGPIFDHWLRIPGFVGAMVLIVFQLAAGAIVPGPPAAPK